MLLLWHKAILSLDHNTYNMKLQFIKKYSGRVCEGTIHFKITFKKKKKKKRVNVIHIKKKKKVELKESQS